MNSKIYNYEIFTDSGANLTGEQADGLGVNMISMNYIEDGEVRPSYMAYDKTYLKDFYRTMRSGKVMTTTSLNIEEYITAFSPALNAGSDILYICFSSAMSGNYNNCISAAKFLSEKYTDRTIRIVDSMSGCCGQGLLTYYAADMKENGKDMDEVGDWLDANKLNVAHWFTVEDLAYLFRGGRVSRGAYMLGSLAQIKPLMHLNSDGVMVAYSKVIGRRKSIQKISDKIAESIVSPEKQYIFINHADCEEDADYLVSKLKSKIDAKGYVVNMLDPVMGCHAGPGSLAAFCMASCR